MRLEREDRVVHSTPTSTRQLAETRTVCTTPEVYAFTDEETLTSPRSTTQETRQAQRRSESPTPESRTLVEARRDGREFTGKDKETLGSGRRPRTC